MVQSLKIFWFLKNLVGLLRLKYFLNHENKIFKICTYPHPAKIDLDKKWSPKEKTIQNFKIDALVFRKTRNENPPAWEIGVTG